MINLTNKSEDKPKEPESGENQPKLPSISLPKGGGAIHDIGEKFSANPVTGTGSLIVPVFTTPGRSGFGPQMSLSYNSGSGNGPFGFGWDLSLPSITRKTDKGLPQYRDSDDSDVFILSGAEDLVPVLVKQNKEWKLKQFDRIQADGAFSVLRYKPRIEGLFARIERWTDKNTGETHWRSISRDNITTLYGKTEGSRISDPFDKKHVFSWLICESYDDKGNAIIYEYSPEDSSKIELSHVHEKNRTDKSRSANRYLKRIKYGNLPSRLIQPDLSQMTWLFEVVFDYDEGHYEELPLDNKGQQFVRAVKDKTQDWSVRKDPFSSYRACFEIRTYRLCRRVLMFHHFPDELSVDDYLVRSTEFEYDESPIASFITGVTQSGYVLKDDGKYLKKSLPPLEFEYSKAIIDEKIHEIDAQSLRNVPYGIDGTWYRWVDLDGEGISGILTEQANTWFYKPNLGDGKLGSLEVVTLKPSLAALNGGRQQLIDLAGDGQLDLVEFGGITSGFYERTVDRHWKQFTPFDSLSNLNWNDPNLKFIDLTGDGHTDILIAEDKVFTWYPSLSEKGFGPAEEVRKPLDEEKGPMLIFADGTESIFLADMKGDGLTDIVRIRNGEVCYWPNLGYGRFGAKITMDNSPWFDTPDIFDQRRIRLADIDGSGTTDIIYLGHNGTHIYFNQSGNSFGKVQSLTQFPIFNNIDYATVIDLFGRGTACILWSSPLQGNGQKQMRYIDLMSGGKPHLLITVRNNMGAETHIQYSPSTKFYLADKAAGNPWITKLPFPVQVVEKVKTYDRISRNLFVTKYAYHHGYFDGLEREFRGFGRVEQLDTEEFAALSASDSFPTGSNIDEASHVPPVLTKTWFHTGAYLDGSRVSRQFENEYFREPGLTDSQYLEILLPDTLLPSDVSSREACEATRALKGSILRQEIYALDGSEKSQYPYSVSENNFDIVMLQPKDKNHYAVFFTHPRETVAYHYERDPSDPRTSHNLTLEIDSFGNVLKSAAFGYGRRQLDATLTAADQVKQMQLLVTYTENNYTNNIDADDVYRTPMPCETQTYELTGLTLPPDSMRFSFEKAKNATSSATPITYETEPSSGILQKRLIEHTRTLYRKNDLSGPLGLHQIESMALPYENYKLAFTPVLINQVYGVKVADTMLSKDGGYVHSEGDLNWWIPSGRIFYSPNSTDTPVKEFAYASQHFFLSHRYRDPFHTEKVSTETFVSYDTYDLLMQETRDALGNCFTVGERKLNGDVDQTRPGNDYRVLQPRLAMDPNRNRTMVAFDALGMVVGTAVMGKPEEDPQQGDKLEETFLVDLTQTEIDQFFVDPKGPMAALLLDKATTRIIYDLTAYWREPNLQKKLPTFAATLARETHISDPVSGNGLKIQVSFSYSDGFGREIQKKIQAEPGPVPKIDPTTGLTITDVNGQTEMTLENVSPRWVGSGWTVFNNKGKPVRKYEPFFTDTHRFEFDVRIGVSPVLFYDPLERVIATLHPNYTWEKVVFNPWYQKTYDVNDTVKIDPRTDEDISGYVSEYFKQIAPNTVDWKTWLQQRDVDPLNPPADVPGLDPDKKAAVRTLVHADTPTISYFDTLGRTFLTVTHNKFKRSNLPATDPPKEDFYPTRILLDIEGNQREVTDAKIDPVTQKGRVVMSYDYDMLGNKIHQASMEAGERWILKDVTGKPIRAWDSRNHNFRTAYDQLRRPIGSFMSEGSGQELLVGRTIYGEIQTNPETKNLRGKVYQIFDQAGIVTSDEYDFKGNMLSSHRQLATDYKNSLNWSQTTSPVVLETETFTSSTKYDALNRPIQIVAPHSDKEGTKINIIQPVYNEANLLEREDVWLEQKSLPNGLLDPATATQHAVKNIDYNAKGQRELIEYGNGVSTTYKYDLLTFRLIHMETLRGAEQLQDLFYTYDPVGNIIVIHDGAQQTIYFNGNVVGPDTEYWYDATYRLIEASGREHIGQASQPQTTWNDQFRVKLGHPNDGQAMRNYFELYDYDEVGNILLFGHKANNGNWNRSYEYNEESLIEKDRKSNRLSRTVVHPNGQQPITEPYTYDIHGNMTSMPHLPEMVLDFKDELQMVDKGGGCKAYYVYDATGQRVRKVIEQNGMQKKERIYLGGFEIYLEYDSNRALKLERETLNIMDDKQRIALVETRTLGNDPAPEQLIRYQFGNHLGSAILELDDQAQIISYEEFYPYGSTSYQAVRSQTETPKRYRYTGKERDEETGLYYHGARYYAAWLGTWTSCDPAGLIDGPNLYRYARNAPTSYTDTSGRDPNSANSEQLQKDDERLNAIGVTRQQVIDFATMTRGDFANKYGGGSIVGEMRFLWNFPSDKVRSLPGDILARILPEADQTLYLQPNGRVSTNANEKATQLQNFNPGTPLGGVTSVATRTVAAVAGLSHEDTERAAGIAGAVGNLANTGLVALGQASRGIVPARGGAAYGKPSTYEVTEPAQSSPHSGDTPASATMGGVRTSSFLESGIEVGYGKTSTRIGTDEATLAVEKLVKPWPNTHDVILHAEGGRFSPGTPEGRFETHEAQIAEAILGNPNLKPGQPLRLLSCALCSEQAQQISNLTGSPVFASPLVVGVTNRAGNSNQEANQFIRFDYMKNNYTDIARKQVWNLYTPKISF